MKRGMWMVAAVAAMVLGGASGVRAADVTSPPGWIDGSGNPNGGFTVVTDNGIELGLRAKYRHNPAVIEPTGIVYSVAPGQETNATSGGNGTSTRAAWNYEFAINLNPTNSTSGYLTLGDIIANLTVSDTHGHTNTVDVLTYWFDNSGYGTTAAKTNPALPTDWAAQNSQNPSFTGLTGFPLQASYDMNAAETYTFTLEISKKSAPTTILASDTIQVNVVPLPASAVGGMALLGVMGGFAGLKRLRAVQA